MTRSSKSKAIYVFIFCIFSIYFLLFTLVFCNISKVHDYFKFKYMQQTITLVRHEDQNDIHILPDNVKKLIAQYNSEEKISNLDIFGKVTADAPVFVVFVEEYKTNFDFLLGSLGRLDGIADALIVFSHLHFNLKVTTIIKTIKFARVIQIYYPYSLQVYPNEFPGYQRNNCTRDIDLHDTERINYTRANATDTQCDESHRDPVQAQKKHFWWWTVNQVFEHLSHTKYHKGLFIFLEDDLFLMKDFIYMTLEMKSISKFLYQCGFVALATAGKNPGYYRTKFNGVNVKSWDPKEHSSVIAFDSDVWKSIATHYDLFCNFDDYSWSRALFYLSLHKKDGRFKVISSTMPRAYKTSELFTYPKKYTDYNIIDTVSRILEVQDLNMGLLYPNELEVVIELKLDDNLELKQTNRGWSDPRDKEMCKNITEL